MSRTQPSSAPKASRRQAAPDPTGGHGEPGGSAYSVIGSFPTMRAAEDALERLAEGVFPIEQISMIARDLESERHVHGFATTGDVARQGAGAGAWLGGLFGVLIGAAFVWVPGFGPLIVAGPLAAALLGGVEHAAGGELLGALAGWGVSEQDVARYEDEVRRGRYLLVAHGSSEQVAYAREVLGEGGRGDLTDHAPPDRRGEPEPEGE